MIGGFGAKADLSMSVMVLQIPPVQGAIKNGEQMQAYVAAGYKYVCFWQARIVAVKCCVQNLRTHRWMRGRWRIDESCGVAFDGGSGNHDRNIVG